MAKPDDQAEQTPEDQEQPNPYWREPPPPPEMPELLTRPVDRRVTPQSKSQAMNLTGFGKAWGTALDFVFTILAGTGLGWVGGRYVGPMPPWVLGGLALGFVIAFIRIVRATSRQEREEKDRRTPF